MFNVIVVVDVVTVVVAFVVAVAPDIDVPTNRKCNLCYSEIPAQPHSYTDCIPRPIVSLTRQCECKLCTYILYTEIRCVCVRMDDIRFLELLCCMQDVLMPKFIASSQISGVREISNTSTTSFVSTIHIAALLQILQ